MAYSDDAVRAKLNSLNETQDSIVANAQWIMFYRRYADRTASLWLSRLQESTPPKRLNLVYLANEVVQQSRARGKQDFMLAFEPIIADATSTAYKGSSQDMQGKIRRVVEVWRQRSIFEKRVLDTVDQRLDELDKQRGSRVGGGGKLGGSLFGGSSIPNELDSVSKNQTALNKAEATKTNSINTANTAYTKISDAATPVPTPPVHASRLSEVMNNLASARSAVEASIKARKELLSSLEKIVETNRKHLLEDETQSADLAQKHQIIEAKKTAVEEAIMRGLSDPATTSLDANGDGYRSDDPARPEVEGFTPPPPDVEAFTPPSEINPLTGDPASLIGDDSAAEQMLASTTGAEVIHEHPPNLNEPTPSFEPPPALPAKENAAQAANDFLNNLQLPAVRHASEEIPAGAAHGNPGDPRLKRRKMSHHSADMDEDIFGITGGDAGVDEEGVAALLGQ